MRNLHLLKWLAYAACTLLLAVLQSQLGFYPHYPGAVPLLPLCFVVSVGMAEGDTAGGVYGALSGLLWDCGTGRVFGFNALFLMVYGVAAGLLARLLFRRTGVTALLFTFAAALLHELLTWFFFLYMTGSGDFVYAMLHIALPAVLATLVFALPVFYGVRALSARLSGSDSGDDSAS